MGLQYVRLYIGTLIGSISNYEYNDSYLKYNPRY